MGVSTRPLMTMPSLAALDAVVVSVPSALVVSVASLVVVSSAAVVVAVSVESPQPTTTSVEAAMTNTATSPRMGRRRCFIESISLVSMGQGGMKGGTVHGGRRAAGVLCGVLFDHADDSQPDEVVELELRRERESGMVSHRLVVALGPPDQQS
jgi:hypothetical protein